MGAVGKIRLVLYTQARGNAALLKNAFYTRLEAANLVDFPKS